jgi:hypothetical protein
LRLNPIRQNKTLPSEKDGVCQQSEAAKAAFFIGASPIYAFGFLAV